MFDRDISPDVLVGETLEYVDFGGDEIRLTTKSGKVFQFYHEQDCCESVTLVDIEGNEKNLVGKVVRSVEVDIDPDNDAFFDHNDEVSRSYEGRTNTKITFVVDDETVITRWVGESNGYYSERVDFAQIG